MADKKKWNINAKLTPAAQKRIEDAAKKYYPHFSGKKGNVSSMISEILEDWRMKDRKRKEVSHARQ